jgi:hypothetical protein
VIYVFRFPLLMTGIAILITFTWPIGMSSPGFFPCEVSLRYAWERG